MKLQKFSSTLSGELNITLFKSNSGKPRVSICIPTYNASMYIGETIRSILKSTYLDLEIIVNDDSSTDNTREIVDSFCDERIRFFTNERNIGVPGNWNRAMKKASGEFVGLLNHDDLYGPFWLSFAVHVLNKFPDIGWVATAYRIINEKGRLLKVVSRFRDTRKCKMNEAFLVLAKMNRLSSAFIVRKKILKEVGYYDEDIGPFADHDLFLRLASKYPLYYSNNSQHAAWRLHSNNLIHSCKHVEQSSLRILKKVFSNDALPSELRKYKKSCYINFYLGILARARKFLKKGDLDSFQRLFNVLHNDGYKDWSCPAFDKD